MSYRIWPNDESVPNDEGVLSDTPHQLSLQGYWGGEKKACVQITGLNCDRRVGYVGLTVAEAKVVGAELQKWAESQEGK